MIKQFFKKFLISYLIIICCIYTPVAQAAGWSFGGYNFGNGSLNIVKDGVKITTAPVNTAPITSNLGSKILSGAVRGANVLTALSLVVGIGESALDWVLDPANNQIKYKDKNNLTGNKYHFYQDTDNLKLYDTPQAACNATDLVAYYPQFAPFASRGVIWNGSKCILDPNNFNWDGYRIEAVTITNDYRTVPVPTVAQQILNNAKSGNTAAQADVTAAVTELVNNGTYDTPINQAIEQAIADGTLPNTGTGTGTNTGTNTDTQIDTSSITAAISSLATSISNSITNAFNGIANVINSSIDKITNKQDQMQGEVVNVGSKVDSVGGAVVGVGDKVDNVGGKVVGVGEAVKDVGGKVVGLNDSVDKVGDAVVGVGEKVTTTGDKVTDAVTGVGDKVTTVGDKVGTKVDTVGEKVTTTGDKVTDAVTGVGDKVTTVGDTVGTKVDSVGEKVTEAVKESTKEITQTIKESKPKDLELPAFCSWASKVCDFIDWVKQPTDEEQNEPIDIQTPDLPQMESTDLNFGGQCPQNFDIDFDLYGKTVNFTLFDSNMFCQFLSDWIRIPVIFSASLVAVYILGGRARD